MYYILVDNDIKLADKDRQKIENTLLFLPDYQGAEILETDKMIYSLGDKFYFEDDAEYIEKKAQAEAERINNLTMTPLDFIGVMVQLGLTLEQINTFLDSNLNIKMQLTYCNLVYCGVVKQFLPITVEGITITTEMIEQAFIIKNGESVEPPNIGG